MQIDELRESLREGVRLFEGLGEDALDDVLRRSRRYQVGRNAALFHQGEPAHGFYLILAGRLKMTQCGQEGQQVILRYLGPREPAGCLAICGELPYPATASAVEDSWLLYWARPVLSDLSARWPQITLNAMRIMGGRMQELQSRVREMQSERAEQRIARALTRLAVEAGRHKGREVEIDFPLSRQDLAEMSGTTLYTVSRTLATWEQAGCVRGGRQKVTILDHEGLSLIAGSTRGQT